MKACIVGYGAIAPAHAQALCSIESAEIYGICDIDRARADSGAAKYGAKAFYDFAECLKDKNIDCIHICTPHYLHYPMIVASLEAGKRVVVEKPATMTKAELDTLFEKYDTTKIFPIVQNRTNNCAKKLREIAASGEYGALRGIRGIVTWCRDKAYYDADHWRGTKEFEGGGVLINQSIHTLDLMVLYAGEVESVSAVMQNNSLKGIIEVEDTVSAYIKFKSGTKGVFFATNAYTSNSPFEIELDFEKKKFLYTDGSLISDGEVICTDSKEFVGKKYWGNGHANAFGDLYTTGTDFCLDSVKDTMYTMFAIYESAKENKEINL